MTGAGEHRTLRHRSCSAPTALDGQQHRRSAGERHDRDRYRGHVRTGRRQRRLVFVVGLATVFRSVTGLVAGLVRIRVTGSGLGRVIRTGSVWVRVRVGIETRGRVRIGIRSRLLVLEIRHPLEHLRDVLRGGVRIVDHGLDFLQQRFISIHAPREGCDNAFVRPCRSGRRTRYPNGRNHPCRGRRKRGAPYMCSVDNRLRSPCRFRRWSPF